MHSFTSNSDTPAFHAATWGIRVWLLCALTACGLLEVGTRYGLPLINSNMRRFHNELAAATRMGQNTETNQASILFLGNSLTLSDIDLGSMQVELGSRNSVVRWAVDDTNYLDWLFGLKRVFRAGGRPRVVVVGGKSGHFLAAHVRDHYFAHYILDWPDLFTAVGRTRADANTTGGMIIAKVSAFYGSRDELYKRVVTLVLPRFRYLASILNKTDVSAGASVDPQVYAAERLGEMKALCEAHGARLILWLPPTPGADRNAQVILEAGRRLDVPVLVPIGEGQIPRSEYVDGFHLGPAGARTTTVALARELKNLMAIGPGLPAHHP